LHTIESQIDPRLLHDIQRELHLLDETLDFALEFEGARTQLVEMAQQKQDVGILDTLKEKPFSALTAEEREMLKNLTVKKT
jgi:DNA primase